jgi:signal transduction histidine kinase
MKNSPEYHLNPDGLGTAGKNDIENKIPPLPDNELVKKSILAEKVHTHLSDSLSLRELSLRKMKLEQECGFLEKEIQIKQLKLDQLNKGISSSHPNSLEIPAYKLAAGLAHEIRNPLTTIKGFIQFMKPLLESDGKIELAEIVMDEINRANDLITDFLTIQKPAIDIKTSISLCKLANMMKNLFTGEALMTNVSMLVKIKDSNLLVYGNENQLKQVIINLLKNAFDALETSRTDQGEIVIELSKKGESAVMSIMDNGPGFDGSVKDRLFSPFYTTKENGTGIGLSICKKIVEEHGGSLSAISRPGYTNFSIQMPLL